MKKKTILFLVLVLLFLMLLTNGLQGEEKEQTVIVSSFVNGNRYLELSKESRTFYVLGLIDMFYSRTFYSNPEKYSYITDFTKDMTFGQIMAIFDKYLEEHPEKWHFNGAALFSEVITEIAYDAKDKNGK